MSVSSAGKLLPVSQSTADCQLGEDSIDYPCVMSLQSSIRAEGFRSLREGEVVEFDVEPGEDGRNKAINVSGPGGAAPLVGVAAAAAAVPSFCPILLPNCSLLA